MSKMKTRGSVDRAKEAVKEAAGGSTGKTSMDATRATHGVWARIQTVCGGLIKALRGR